MLNKNYAPRNYTVVGKPFVTVRSRQSFGIREAVEVNNGGLGADIGVLSPIDEEAFVSMVWGKPQDL